MIITGGSGLLGTAFKEILKNQDDTRFPNKSLLNLENKEEVFKYLSQERDVVIHLAGKVGGIKANLENMSDFYMENSIINNNIIYGCLKNKIPKLVCCLSTCVYPKEEYVQYPLTENQLHNGPPHDSNYAYSYAKRMVDIQLKSIRKQYGLKYISVIPNNMYGENDNFHLNDSHVIPALIRKIWEAKLQNKSKVDVWGSGEPLREFTYSQDIAKIILFLLENYDSDEPINIGNTEEYSIKEIVKIISNFLEYDGKISWQTNLPTGQIRKPTSNKKLLDLGWKKENYTPLNTGIKKTCEWFKLNYPNIRGIV